MKGPEIIQTSIFIRHKIVRLGPALSVRPSLVQTIYSQKY
uniref:Uncharacterized protein n=1 Tax=Manihot esculenta TaxID=3983 RepID=A0A2C9WAZ2_MANES